VWKKGGEEERKDYAPPLVGGSRKCMPVPKEQEMTPPAVRGAAGHHLLRTRLEARCRFEQGWMGRVREGGKERVYRTNRAWRQKRSYSVWGTLNNSCCWHAGEISSEAVRGFATNREKKKIEGGGAQRNSTAQLRGTREKGGD